MKHLLALLFSITLYLSGCSNTNTDMPTITIVSVYIEGDETNYYNKLDRIPELTIGDKIDFGISLDGNGNDIFTFMVQNKFDEYISTALYFEEDEISDYFSEPTEGQLTFVDNMRKTTLKVEAEIKSIAEEEIILTFILFSKNPESEGAIMDVISNTGIRETEE